MADVETVVAGHIERMSKLGKEERESMVAMSELNLILIHKTATSRPDQIAELMDAAIKKVVG